MPYREVCAERFDMLLPARVMPKHRSRWLLRSKSVTFLLAQQDATFLTSRPPQPVLFFSENVAPLLL